MTILAFITGRESTEFLLLVWLRQEEGKREAISVALKEKEAEVKIWKAGSETSVIQPIEGEFQISKVLGWGYGIDGLSNLKICVGLNSYIWLLNFYF